MVELVNILTEGKLFCHVWLPGKITLFLLAACGVTHTGTSCKFLQSIITCIPLC